MDKHVFALERGFAALEALSRAAAEARGARELYAEACRIAVATTGLRMAWVGRVDSRGNVVPLSMCGNDQGYLVAAGITTRHGHRGDGPTGRAIREKRVVVSQDIAHDDVMAPWRDAALARGFGSSAAFPILRRGEVIGALSVYAAQPRAFTPSLMRVLEAMANLLSGVEPTIRAGGA